MEKLLNNIKKNFLSIYTFSIWIFSLLSPLIFLPAIFSEHFDGPVIKGISIFLITALIASFYIFLPRTKNLSLSRRYIIWGFISLVFGVVALLIDIHWDKSFTVEKPQGTKHYVVIGSQMKDSIRNILLQQHINPEKIKPADLFSADGTSSVNDVYFENDIDLHAYLLLFAYFLVLLSLVAFIILTSYAVQIKNQFKDEL